MIKIKNKPLCKSLGIHIRMLRKQVLKSQEQLANDADVPLSQIGRIERGEINPTLSTLYVISKALNTDLKRLMDFTIEE
ncbi:MAG: helix-turn-helix domain-containing protein [Chitinophagales bacterium]